MYRAVVQWSWIRDLEKEEKIWKILEKSTKLYDIYTIHMSTAAGLTDQLSW